MTSVVRIMRILTVFQIELNVFNMYKYYIIMWNGNKGAKRVEYNFHIQATCNALSLLTSSSGCNTGNNHK